MESDSSIQIASDSSRPDWVCLNLSGMLTTNVASRLHRTALELLARNEHVAISLEGVTQLSSANLQVILCLARDLAGRSRQCDLNGINETIQCVFDVTGLNR